MLDLYDQSMGQVCTQIVLVPAHYFKQPRACPIQPVSLSAWRHQAVLKHFEHASSGTSGFAHGSCKADTCACVVRNRLVDTAMLSDATDHEY